MAPHPAEEPAPELQVQGLHKTECHRGNPQGDQRSAVDPEWSGEEDYRENEPVNFDFEIDFGSFWFLVYENCNLLC